MKRYRVWLYGFLPKARTFSGKTAKTQDGEDQDEPGPGARIAEPAVGRLEVPVELGLPDRRELLQAVLVDDAGGGSLDHHIQPRAELIGSRGKDAAGIGFQVPGFLLARAGAGTGGIRRTRR